MNSDYQGTERYEKKYLLRNEKYILSQLSAFFEKDSEYQENFIFNIYFDDAGLNALYEKLNGDLRRAKVRVRWYDVSPKLTLPKKAKLEVKIKNGAKGFKTSAEIDFPVCDISRVLSRTLWCDTLRLNLPNDLSLPSNLPFPVMLSRYRRRRFIDPVSQTRLSYDDRISSVALSPALRARGVVPRAMRHSILEVKNRNGDLPPLLDGTDLLRETSYSKYGHLLEH